MNEMVREALQMAALIVVTTVGSVGTAVFVALIWHAMGPPLP